MAVKNPQFNFDNDIKEYDCIQNGDFCSHWLLLDLVSAILYVIVSISISVLTEVSGLSFRLELVDIVNHCWIEKKKDCYCILSCMQRSLLLLGWCYDPRKKTVLFWLSEINDGLAISLKDIFQTEESFFCWPYNLGNILKYLVNKEACVGPVSYYQISPIFLQFCWVFVLYFQVAKSYIPGLEIKKILRSPFGDQLEKCSHQM